MTLPTDPKKRKDVPVATGCVDYFPDALVAVAELSRIGNEQHNPGKPLHWDRSKSGDESDALMRHFVERGTIDTDGIRHSAKVAWRALALLQKEIESEKAPPELETPDAECLRKFGLPYKFMATHGLPGSPAGHVRCTDCGRPWGAHIGVVCGPRVKVS